MMRLPLRKKGKVHNYINKSIKRLSTSTPTIFPFCLFSSSPLNLASHTSEVA